MTSFLIFFAKSILCSFAFWLYYTLALRNSTLHRFNRVYLLFAAITSLLIPLLQVSLIRMASAPAPLFPLLHSNGAGTAEATSFTASAKHTIDWLPVIAAAVYILVSVGLLVKLLAGMVRVWQLKKNGKATRMQDYQLITTQDPAAPFSFMHLLFWPEHMRMETPEGHSILQHELVHIRQYHSLDKLLLQLLVCVCWINPFYWLLRKELTLQHEFLADKAALAQQDSDGFARMLLYAAWGPSPGSITNAFRQSPVKRRLAMLTIAPGGPKRLRRLAVLPLTGLLLGIFSFTTADTRRADKTIRLIVDAAHGGDDAGATSNSGLQEKDYCLRIAQTMQALAPAYNIEVIMTRETDRTLPLQDRIAFCNNTAADLCLSVHVNKKPAGSTSVYELGFSNTAAQHQESQLLASAVGNRLQQAGQKICLTDMRAAIVRQNKHTTLLLECGNMDDAAHPAMGSDRDALNTFCRDILAGVVDFAAKK